MAKSLKDVENIKGVSALIFAPPKTGKTHMIKDLEGDTLIIDTGDGGIETLLRFKCENVEYEEAKSMKSLHTIAVGLQDKCKYNNVVIDTFTQVRKQAILNRSKTAVGAEDITQKLGWDDWGSIKNGSALIFELFKMLTEQGVNVIFTAWETTDKVVKETGEEYHRFLPDTGHKLLDDVNSIAGLVSMVGRLCIAPDGINRYIRFKQDDQHPCCGDRRFNRLACAPKDLINGKGKVNGDSKNDDGKLPEVQTKPATKD